MGSIKSKLERKTIYSNLIITVDENRIIYRESPESTVSSTLYFEKDIMKDSYYLFSKIINTGGSYTLYHNKSKIFVVCDNISNQSYVSNKAIPQSDGWYISM